MPKRATIASDNVYCQARYRAAEYNDSLSSREGASEVTGIDRTRIARTELGTVVPYPEEVMVYADVYNAPELLRSYCKNECVIGKRCAPSVRQGSFAEVCMRVLGATQDIEETKKDIIRIAGDGELSDDEREEFRGIVDRLRDVVDSVVSMEVYLESRDARGNLADVERRGNR